MAHHEQLRQLLDRLQSPDDEDIICDLALFSSSSGYIPAVTEAFDEERNGLRRAALVRVAWESRDTRTLPLLARALADPDARVWKEALDGLVTLGGDESLRALMQERIRLSGCTNPSDKAAWIDEAVGQINESNQPPESN